MPEVPPPMRVASSTVTAAPACASRYATEAPITPAPITIVFIICISCGSGRASEAFPMGVASVACISRVSVGPIGAARWGGLPGEFLPPRLLHADTYCLEIVSCSGPWHQTLQAQWRTAIPGFARRACFELPPSLPQHRLDLVEASDARVHFHRLVEAVGVSGGIAAPAAFAHYHRRDVEVEGLTDTRLDAAIGGAAADDDRIAPQHMQELGHTCPVEGARPALEEDVILGPRRDIVGEAGLRRAFDSIGEWRHAGLRREVGRQQHDDVGAIGAADGVV